MNPTPFRFHFADVQWKRNACATLGLRFEKPNGVYSILRVQPIAKPSVHGDGNCLFRTFPHTICGSEGPAHGSASGHPQPHGVGMCSASVAAWPPSRLCQHCGVQNCKKTKMDRDGFWGTEVEMLALAHLLHTRVYSYVSQLSTWNQYGPTNVEAHCNVLLNPCTSDNVLTTLMWSVLFATPSDLTLSGLLPICLVCGTSHMHAVLTPSGHTHF